jgi:hypothetical protein
MCIPIVDDQSLALGLGEGDVCSERLALRGVTGSITGAVEVEAGLPYYSDAWIRHQSLDDRKLTLQRWAQPGSVVRVDRYASNNVRPLLCRRDRPSRALDVAPDLHNAGDTNAASPFNRLDRRQAGHRFSHIEMAVRINHR